MTCDLPMKAQSALHPARSSRRGVDADLRPMAGFRRYAEEEPAAGGHEQGRHRTLVRGDGADLGVGTGGVPGEDLDLAVAADEIGAMTAVIGQKLPRLGAGGRSSLERSVIEIEPGDRRRLAKGGEEPSSILIQRHRLGR